MVKLFILSNLSEYIGLDLVVLKIVKMPDYDSWEMLVLEKLSPEFK